jgi:hypothetical protein
LSRDLRTFSLPSASTCSRARESPVRVDGVDGDHVVAAEGGDGACEHGLDAFAETDLASHVACNALVGGTSHELERFLNSRFGNQIQVGRLLELDGEGLLQSAIEDGVSRGVDEVGEKDRILFREGTSAMRGEESAEDNGGDNGGEGEPKPRFALNGLRDDAGKF